MKGIARKLEHAKWVTGDDPWRGKFEGRDLETGITVLFYATNEVGQGPAWHIHPYDEIFIIRQGKALFTIGKEQIAAETGDVLLGPANVPHKYANVGPGRLESIDIHVSDTWIQTDLDDPELS